MTPPSPFSRRGASRTLLLVAGAAFLLGAVLYNPWCVSLLVRAARSATGLDFGVPAAARVFAVQLGFLAVAVAWFAASWLIGRVPALERWFRRPRVETMVLVAVVVAVPMGGLELAMRAFGEREETTTSIFMRDDRLGWRLRPNAVDLWGGTEVRTNERGYRGPAVPYQRTAGVRRVLYLGDSVTFGYRVARWQETFPFLADSLVAARDSTPVETVNLAVEGYSQWQQAIVWADEGARYRPDLVVVGFVLNDVTEMFDLVRFGGAEEGFQMRHAVASRLDGWLSRSALVSGIRDLTRKVKAKRRLGEDLRLGAIKQEALDVETLMRRPDQTNVKLAWRIALADLQKIADQCAAQRVPLLVVVFPFAAQLSDPVGLGAPQRVITTYAEAHGIPVVDLLPLLVSYARESGSPASDLFLDYDHLTVKGHRAVAELIAGAIAQRLPPH